MCCQTNMAAEDWRASDSGYIQPTIIFILRKIVVNIRNNFLFSEDCQNIFSCGFFSPKNYFLNKRKRQFQLRQPKWIPYFWNTFNILGNYFLYIHSPSARGSQQDLCHEQYRYRYNWSICLSHLKFLWHETSKFQYSLKPHICKTAKLNTQAIYLLKP